MRNTIYAAAFLTAMLTLTACDVSQGGGCERIGSQHTNKDGTKFECIELIDKNGVHTGRGFWRKA